MTNFRNKAIDKRAENLDFLKKIWSRVTPEKKEDEIIASYMRMVHNSLNASATSLLLVDEEKQELYFKFATGPASEKLNRLHIGRQSGIAGWVVQKRRPVVVNNPEKNANFYARIDDVTGFKTRSIIAVPLMFEGKVMGVIEALNKKDDSFFTKNDLNAMIDIANMAAVTLEKTRMNAYLLDSFKGTVKALVSLADAKETCGGGHSRRVSEYAVIAARELGLSRQEKLAVEYAGLLHDIGKLGIPDDVLNKQDALSKEEWQMMRKHPIIGFNILKDIPYLKLASLMVLYHHERYDGAGYPHGISGEKIPVGARLLAIADAFDYMTVEHKHRTALTGEKAMIELAKNANTQFCPVALKAFNSGYVRARILHK